MPKFRIQTPLYVSLGLTGTTRDATQTGFGHMLDFAAQDRGGVPICFAPNTDIAILSARIIPDAPGLFKGTNDAATLNIKLGTQDDCDIDDELWSGVIELVDWDAVEKQCINIPSTALSADGQIYAFVDDTSVYRWCDYNIQDDWQNEVVHPQLELIIDAPFLLTLDGNRVY